jgi:hypothetical protein
MLLSVSSRAQLDPPRAPAVHRRIPHPELQVGATLGWTGAFGDVDDPIQGGLDDLVVSSIHYNFRDTATGQVWADLGAAYVFAGSQLPAHGFFPRLLPAPEYQVGMSFGQLDVEIGDVRGTAAAPMTGLVLVGAVLNHGEVADCPAGQVDHLGSVEMFDLTVSGSALRLLPPFEGGSCPPDARGFGEAIGVGDVDGDGTSDLVVGAPTSDGGYGRVYVFFGHAAFLSNPYLDWVGFKAPTDPQDPLLKPETFGVSLGLADLDGDGKSEIIVGAPGKARGGSDGHAYIYDGSVVSDPGSLAHYAVHDHTTAIPAQVLAPPPQLLPDTDFLAMGWQVFEVGDLAGTRYGLSDGRPEIAVHTEAGRWQDPAQMLGHVNRAGSLLVYVAWDAGDTIDDPLLHPFVKPDPIILYTPLVTHTFDEGGVLVQHIVHLPQDSARFGRAAAPVEWTAESGATFRGLLVGEPDADVYDFNDPEYPGTSPVEDAGRVFLFEAPLDQGQHHLIHALGELVLLEPSDGPDGSTVPPLAGMSEADMTPQPSAAFGSWISTGRYNPFAAGQQVMIAARNRLLIDAQMVPYAGAGQVYTYYAPSEP